MAAKVIPLVQGDNLPYISLTLTDNATGSVLNVSGAVVRVYFRAVGQTTVLATLFCIPLLPDGSDGRVKFYFPGTTLDVPEGMYEGEIEVDFGGLKQTVYETLKFRVRAQFA